jgi:hypothetical protein
MTQQAEREILALGVLWRLRDAACPVRGHLRARGAVVQLAEAVRGEDEEGARGQAAMHDVRHGRDVRRCAVPSEERLPRRWVCHARIEVIEHAASEYRRLLERRIADAWWPEFCQFKSKGRVVDFCFLRTAEGRDRAEHARV